MSEPQVSEIIIRGIVVGVFQENCWVIGNRRTGEAICIDPGDQHEEILAMARDMGVAIKAIANSHAHVDHILGVRGVQAATGAKFYMHRKEAPIAAQAARSALMFTGQEVEPPPDPDFFPEEGDEIEVEGVKLTVMHTPGHTPGSCCFLIGRYLISGDTLFPGGPGRTNSPQELQQTIASIRERLYTLPDDTLVLPGHGEGTTIGRSREEYAAFAARPHAADLCGDVTWEGS